MTFAVALSFGTITRSLCMLCNMLFSSGDERQFVCLYLYELFARQVILSSILFVTLLVYSQK